MNENEWRSKHDIKHLSSIFSGDDSDTILFVHADNAFNRINRNIMLYSIQITCPIIATYKTNSCNQKARPFISGEEEITSTEGTTQGDPTSMPIYTLTSSQLINITRTYSAKNAVYGDDIGCVEN